MLAVTVNVQCQRRSGSGCEPNRESGTLDLRCDLADTGRTDQVFAVGAGLEDQFPGFELVGTMMMAALAGAAVGRNARYDDPPVDHEGNIEPLGARLF